MTLTLRSAAITVICLWLAMLGFAYLAWLDQGCELAGMMTWAGKVCV